MTTKDKQRTRAVRRQQEENRLRKQLLHNELKQQAEVKAESDAPELDDELKSLEPEEKHMDPMPYMAYGGATTFADAFAAMEAEEAARKMHEHTYLFQEIVSNILGSEAIMDKAGAIAAAAEELKAIMAMSDSGDGMLKAGDRVKVKGKPHMPGQSTGVIKEVEGTAYAILFDGETEVHKWYTAKELELLEGDGMKSTDAEPVEVGSDNDKSILSQLGDWLKAKMNPDKPAVKESKRESLPFFVYKDSEGHSHWFGVVSNKFRDRDTRRHAVGEIITEAAHKEYVAYLDLNPAQAPELWTWHTPGTARKSRADWWDYTGDGFLVMSGPLTDDEAKAFEANELLGMSHGFYPLERDEKQGLILKYRTFEVSELPPQFVANEWTDFAAIRKELTMAFNPDKRAALVKRFGEAKVAEREGKTGEMAKALEAIGAEWKDTQPPVTEPPPADKTGNSETLEHVLAALNLPELQKGIAAISEQAALVPKLQAQLKTLEDKIAALNKSDDEKIAEKLAPKVKPFDWGFRASADPSTAINKDAPTTEDVALKNTAPSDSWVKNISPIVA